MLKNNCKKYFVLKSNLILFFLFFSSATNSQSIKNSESNSSAYNSQKNYPVDEIKFERIPSELGLSGTLFRIIFQDSYGFIWFGWNDRLIRFDGFGVKVYENNVNNSNSIPDNDVFAMFEDKQKTLWIGTSSGDIAKYDKDFDRFITVSNEESIPTDAGVRTIIEDKNGNLLIGTTRTGIKLYNKKESKFEDYFEKNSEYYSLFPSNVVSRMLFIDENRLLFGGYDGLGIYDKRSNTIIKFTHDSLNSKSLSNNRVKCIFKDSRDRYFIGTENGLNIFDIFNYTFNSVGDLSNNILNICEDRNNEIWIGSVNGFYKYKDDGTIQSFTNDVNDPNSISGNEFYPYIDRSNVLWVGSSAGIFKLDCERKRFHTISKVFMSPENNYEITTSSLNIDSAGLIWIGVRFRDGIFKFRKNIYGLLIFEEHFFVTKKIEHPVLTNIVFDKNSNLWMCYFIGGYLVKYQIDNRKVDIINLSPNWASDICLLNNNLLISVNRRGGIKNFDIKEEKFVNIASNYPALSKLPNDNFTFLYPAKNNTLWIASESSGLFQYDLNRDTLYNYKNNKDNSYSLSGNEIISIIEDSKNNLWVGTGAGGIDKFDESHKVFTRYNFGDSLNSKVKAIIEDNSGYLWLSSDNGLYKFDPVKLTTQHYDNKDGVLSYGFGYNACAKDRDGTLYFAGSKGGLTYFNPSEIKDNPYIPNIVITDFQIFNQSVKSSSENPFLKKNITVAENITLSYKENVFSFEFAALIYNNPSKNQYAYMMEGFDKDWVYCGTRRNVTYTNLDPGDYTFKVKGSNNDGIWNEEGTSIKITITPPWWQTWWFKSCWAALVLLTAGFGYKKRVSKLKREKLAQEEYSRKLLASQEAERKRIANELHDSIAHDILILKNNAVIAMNKTTDEETKSALNEISEQSSSTLNEVRSISYNLHPHQIEALGITKAIKSMVEKVAKSVNINFILEEDIIDRILTEENEVYLFRIIQECINNIIKHSSATEARINISRKEDSVSITISDNGKGFSMSRNENKSSMGLTGISERVKMLKGTLYIESEEGKGTLVKVLIPIPAKK